MDETDNHAAAPGARVHFSLAPYLRIRAGDLIVDVVNRQALALFALDFQQTVRSRIPEDALGVPQLAHNWASIELGRGHQRSLQVLM